MNSYNNFGSDIYFNNEIEYHRILKKNVTNSNNFRSANDYEYKNIDVFSNKPNNKYIVHAIRGIITQHLIGTTDEKLYYKIKILNGTKNNKKYITLYYNSPEEYENHLDIKLDEQIKKNWYEEKNKYLEEI